MVNTEVGKLIDGNAKRDAIHIAVAPVTTNERLSPGQPVGHSNGIASSQPPHIGIVDPFLRGAVMPGDRFFMFLNPNTITSLRHEWVHPEFPEVAVVASAASKEASEAWLRRFCESSDCPGYETVLAAAIGDHKANNGDDGYNYSRNDGEYLHFGGSNAHGDIPPEFWTHVEVVTGQKIPQHQRASSFSCSC